MVPREASCAGTRTCVIGTEGRAWRLGSHALPLSGVCRPDLALLPLHFPALHCTRDHRSRSFLTITTICLAMASCHYTASTSTSSSSSSSPQRKIALLAGLFCLARICVASPLSEQQQITFNAHSPQSHGAVYKDETSIADHDLGDFLPLSSSSSSSAVNLHRMCIPSSSSSHWATSVLPALEALASRHSNLPLDVWRYPYRMPRVHKGAVGLEVEEECIDFTYPSSDVAEEYLENLVSRLPQEAELGWQLLADDEELARRVEVQKGQNLPRQGRTASEEEQEEEQEGEKDVAIAGRKARKSKGRKAQGGRKDKQTKIVDDHFHNGYHALEK